MSKLIVVLLSILLLLALPLPGLADPSSSQSQSILTEELLQERLDPVSKEGIISIDLHNLIIDLTDDNAEFRDRFYEQLQSKLNRSQQPLGIDLSESLIKGQLVASRLGLQTSLHKAALSSLLTEAEQEQLQQDERFSEQGGKLSPIVSVFRGSVRLDNSRFTGVSDFSETFFLKRLSASGATWEQESDWHNVRFGEKVDFSNAVFEQDANFSDSTFFAQAKLNKVQFGGNTNFTHSSFEEATSFTESKFSGVANFTQVFSGQEADFNGISWGDRVLFSQSQFLAPLCFANSTFEEAVAFRGTIFNAPVDFQDVKLLDQVDFSNAVFAEDVKINVTGLAFDSDKAKIFGDTGVIGSVISLPTLEGNNTVLRNLVRNFRSQEQIPDANQVEYTKRQLKLEQLTNRILGASMRQMFEWHWLRDILYWLALSLLLRLSDYGTSFGLVVGIGIVAIAYFSILYWFIDRWRRRFPTPILPGRYESICMLSSFSLFTVAGLADIFALSDRPWLTLLCLGFFLVPLPVGLVWRLYRQGRYHNLLDLTYFVEDGSARQLRLLIVRLPIMPRFEFFRDRYKPILWDRRWNWLNYYDLSLNNLFKLGFNDIRLRDEYLPGIISTLVWYQWGLGILYIALLFWTLSRTIPGLNLLIYLK